MLRTATFVKIDLYDKGNETIPPTALESICMSVVRPLTLHIQMVQPHASSDDFNLDIEDHIAERLQTSLRQITQSLQADRLRTLSFAHVDMDGLPSLLMKASATLCELQVFQLNEDQPVLPHPFTIPEMPHLTSLTLGQGAHNGDIHLALERKLLSATPALESLEVERYPLREEQRLVAMFGSRLCRLKVNAWRLDTSAALEYLQTLSVTSLGTTMPLLPPSITTLQVEYLSAESLRDLLRMHRLRINRLQYIQFMELVQGAADAELLAPDRYDEMLEVRSVCAEQGLTMLDGSGRHVQEDVFERLLPAARVRQAKLPKRVRVTPHRILI